MHKSRRRPIKEFNANLDLLEQCISPRAWRKLKRVIGADSSIKKGGFENFIRVIDEIDSKEWATYLRKLRDKEYERKRVRISIRKKTAEHIERIIVLAGYNNIDEILCSLDVDDGVVSKITTFSDNEVEGVKDEIKTYKSFPKLIVKG